jgi:glycerate kinase
MPIADGGEGTVHALVQASQGRLVRSRVTGPLGDPVEATWGLLGGGDTAVIEMAAASGLPLIPRDQRDPTRTSTYGTGELIRHAVEHGARRLIVGIGGSATNDGGAGMAQALGVRLLDESGAELPPGGAALARLASIDVSGLEPRLQEITVEVACDVRNPLTGPNGASHVYGPQKGATSDVVETLDAALNHFASLIERDVGKDVAEVPGSGAAGGLGAGLMAFLGASLKPGIDIVFSALRVEERLRGASLVFTGEGRLDSQDVYGKGPMAIAQLARRMGIPTIAVVGSTGRDYRVLYNHGLDAVIGTVTRPMPLDRAVREAPGLVTEAAMRACRIVRVGMDMQRTQHDTKT